MRKREDETITWSCGACSLTLPYNGQTAAAIAAHVQQHVAEKQRPAMPVVPTPEPVMVSAVCSTCGLDWIEHPHNPTATNCVQLLLRKKIELTGEVDRLRAELRSKRGAS